MTPQQQKIQACFNHTSTQMNIQLEIMDSAIISGTEKLWFVIKNGLMFNTTRFVVFREIVKSNLRQ